VAVADRSVFVLEPLDGAIRLKTTSYRADRGSVLHSGIFSRELASSFVAAGAAAAFIIVFAIYGVLRLVHYIMAAAVFVIVFPLARIFIFKERYLETVLDTRSGEVRIAVKGGMGKKEMIRPLKDLKDIRISWLRVEPENPDGIAVVEKIALQHGTVIPGFGEVKEFFNVELVFDKESFTILTVESEPEAVSVVERLKEYMAG